MLHVGRMVFSPLLWSQEECEEAVHSPVYGEASGANFVFVRGPFTDALHWAVGFYLEFLQIFSKFCYHILC